jgi:translation elongation factor EF-G
MEIDLLVASLVLASCVFLGVCGIIITRNKTTLTPIARRKLKEYEEELKSNYIEQRRLKGTIARQKRGPEISQDDISAGGTTVLDTVIDGLPSNYKKIAQKYKHLVEPLIMDKDGNLKPEVTEKLTSIISKSNTTTAETSSQSNQSL